MDTEDKSNRPGRVEYQQALRSMNTYIDITVDDLMALSDRAQRFASHNATESLGVSRVMSRPVRTVHPDTTVKDAARIMVSERISGLPIVDDEERLVGLITEADFLRALGVPAQQPHHSLWHTLESLFSHLAHHERLEAPDDPVSEYMIRNVLTVGPEHDLRHVIGMMKQYYVKRVVVCDDSRRVLGMVTRSDLVRVFFAHCTEAGQ